MGAKSDLSRIKKEVERAATKAVNRVSFPFKTFKQIVKGWRKLTSEQRKIVLRGGRIYPEIKPDWDKINELEKQELERQQEHGLK